MKKVKKVILSWIAIVVLTFGQILPALAQEEVSLTLEPQKVEINSTEANIENDASYDLLGADEPMIKPDSALYFIKEWGRGIEDVFSFSEEAKIETNLEQASERLADIQSVIADSNANGAVVGVMAKQQADLSLVEAQLKTIANTSDSFNRLSSMAVEKYSAFEKVYANQESTIIEANQSILREIYDAKEAVLDNLATHVENISEDDISLDKILGSQPGSEFKDFRNLEVLSALSGRLPEKASEAVIAAQKNIEERLVQKFSVGANGKNGEAFSEYVMAIKGSEADHMAVLQDLAKNPNLPDEVVAGFRKAKDAVAEKFSLKMIKHPASDEMMADIASGDIDKLIVLEEMADSIPDSSEVKLALNEAREKGLEMAAEKMNAIESVDDKIDFLIKDGIPDAKSFVMLEKIQAKLPANQQEKMAEVRNQAFQVFSDIVDSAENSEKLLERLAGDSPADIDLIAVIKKSLPAQFAGKIDKLAQKQLEKIEARLSEETDVTKLIEMRSVLDESPEAREMIRNLAPDMIAKINEAQVAKMEVLMDQAVSTEEMVRMSNQYNSMLEKYPDVAEAIKNTNPELIQNIAKKQVERIKNDLANAGTPEKAREMMRNLDVAGLAQLKGSLPPELEAQIGTDMKAQAKDMEREAFLNEMKSRMGEDFDEAEAEKMFVDTVGSMMDSSEGMPDEAKIQEMKQKMEAETSKKMMTTQKEKVIRKQVEEELKKNSNPDAPDAGEVMSKILQDDEVKNMTEKPSQEKIDAVKARMEAESRAKAEAEARARGEASARSGAPVSGPPAGHTPPTAPPDAPSEMPSSPPTSAPSIDCGQFAGVPSCDYVPAIAQDACRKCK